MSGPRKGDKYAQEKGISTLFVHSPTNPAGERRKADILGKNGPAFVGDPTPQPREYYYNSVGGRILTRPMKIVGTTQETYDWQPVQGLYGFYDEFADNGGLTPTGDFRTAFSFNGNTMFEGDQYMPGAGGLRGRQKYAETGEPEEYWHADLVGSTTRLSDAAGQQTGPAVRYTAFGEVIQPDNSRGGQLPSQYPRYGYVGEYGYESDMLVLAGAAGTKPIVLSHVGARWYESAIGRFVQRDLLSVFGGLNTYAYVDARPGTLTDPSGLSYVIDYDWSWKHFLVAAGAKAFQKGLFGASAGGCAGAVGGPAGAAAGAVAGGATGAATGAAEGALVYIGGWSAVCVWDIGALLHQKHQNDKRSREQRDSRPDVFPPGGPPESAPPFPPPFSPGCFPSGTLVWTPKGLVPIDTIVPDAFVLGYIQQTAATAESRVESTLSAMASEFIQLVLDDETIMVTPEHEFMIEGSGWVRACNLQPGQVLATITGQFVCIRAVVNSSTAEAVTVYNMETTPAHTFYVGEVGIVVHNRYK